MDKSTRPIPTIHALVASQKALTEAWRADLDKLPAYRTAHVPTHATGMVAVAECAVD